MKVIPKTVKTETYRLIKPVIAAILNVIGLFAFGLISVELLTYIHIGFAVFFFVPFIVLVLLFMIIFMDGTQDLKTLMEIKKRVDCRKDSDSVIVWDYSICPR